LAEIGTLNVHLEHDSGAGPSGIMEKYFGYWNAAFTAIPNRPTTNFYLRITLTTG
jgi:hypothetical protein